MLDSEGKAPDASKYKDDIKMVQLRIDELASQLEENKENKFDLNNVLQRAPKPASWKGSKEETGKSKEIKKPTTEAARQIKLSESGQLFLEAN